MKIPDHFYGSLETVFWVKNTKFFDEDPDPGSGIFSNWILDKHTRSATLGTRVQ
jgi:hypothetical protein